MRVRAALAALAIPAAGVLVAASSAAATMLPAAAPCAAATFSSHVTLVVEHGDSSVIGLCIGFDGSSITGEQVLEASGLRYATQSYGSLGDAVCQIDGEPASYGTCLPASGSYWAMFVSRGGGGWQNADRGISSETFGDGDAEGFRYESQNGAEPAPASPAGICARALAASGAADSGAPSAPEEPTAGSAPGGSSGAAGANAGSSGTSSQGGALPTSAAAPDPATTQAVTPAPSVISPVSPRGPGVASTVANRTPPAGIDVGLLFAAVAAGALCGLIVIQVVRRRRT